MEVGGFFVFTIYADKEMLPLLERELLPYLDHQEPFQSRDWIGLSFPVLKQEIVKGILQVLLKGYEEADFRRRLVREFHFDKEEEIGSILFYVDQFTQEGDEGWRKELEEEIASLLIRHPSLHLGGFFRFRWRHHAWRRKDLLEQAIDEYILDREYREYVELLKELMKEKTEREEVNLVHKGGREFILLNEEGLTIRVKRRLDEMGLDDGDSLLTDLITLAPKRLIIHTHEQESPLFRTIAQLFPERITYCNGCFMCETDWNRVRT